MQNSELQTIEANDQKSSTSRRRGSPVAAIVTISGMQIGKPE
jgi:hypothetical protein